MLPWRQRSIVLRDLSVEDAPALARLHGLAFHRGWSEDEFEHLVASSTSIGEGAFSDRGLLRGFVLSRAARFEAEMLSILVDPSFRREGIARALLSNHLDRLRERHVQELFLEVDEHNHAALAFYGGFGLMAVGRRDAYYPRSSGGPAAALILRRTLYP